MAASIPLELIRISIVFGMLLYGSYRDVRAREVDDKVWIISAFMAGGVWAYEILFLGVPKDALLILLAIGLPSGLVWLLYYLGFYGGADAKALATLSLIMPLYGSPYQFHPMTALTTLTNGLFVSLSLPLKNLGNNLYRMIRGDKIFSSFEDEPAYKKVLTMFLGYRLRGSPEGKFLLSMESREGDRRRLRLSWSKLDEEFVTESDLWVTQGLPLLIYMTFGFAVTLVFGDIIAILITTILPR